jgi:hypothetical protein
LPAVAAADKVDRSLHDLRDSRSTPRWKGTTLVRAGNLYDCIRSRFARSNPALFTPKQQVLINRLQAPAPPSPVNSLLQAQVNSTVQAVQEHWTAIRSGYLDTLTRQTVRPYVTAALLARLYAFDGFRETRAGRRLAIVARELGKEAMIEILRGVVDPTVAPPAGDGAPQVRYFTGAFD